jgi:hypothetical protein
MDNISELSTGGILIVIILKIVFDFLKERKSNGVNGNTQYFAKPSEYDKHISEIHDVLLAQPPRPSLFATVTRLDESMRDQVQKQKEAVHVLGEIRDEIRNNKCLLLDDQKKT